MTGNIRLLLQSLEKPCGVAWKNRCTEGELVERGAFSWSNSPSLLSIDPTVGKDGGFFDGLLEFCGCDA